MPQKKARAGRGFGPFHAPFRSVEGISPVYCRTIMQSAPAEAPPPPADCHAGEFDRNPEGCIDRHTSSARTAAARLIAHETRNSHGASDGVHPAANALRRAALGLSQWVGPDGCHALINRAVNRAAQTHPILHNVKIDTNSAPIVIAVEDVVGTHGAAAVAAALNATLVEFFELLVRVVGEDLTMKLAQQVTAHDPTDVGPVEGEEPV